MNTIEKELAVYLPEDRLQVLINSQSLPDRVRGTALFADISGFTPLTEKLTQQFGARRGIEELTKRINTVYDVLTSIVERQGNEGYRLTLDEAIQFALETIPFPD